MSTRPGGPGRPSQARLLAALALSLFGCLAVGLAGPAAAAVPTATVTPIPGFVQGRHVYDYGKLLSPQLVNTVAAMATQIERAGGGRVVIYTAASPSNLPHPDALAQDWHVDGMLLTCSGGSGTLTLGSTLKAKLTAEQVRVLDEPSGPQTLGSWITSTLARASALASGTHVFDGTGVLGTSGRNQAEAAAKALSVELNTPVYIDIALGGTDPSSTASLNAASLSGNFDKALVIALAVSDTEMAGSIGSTSSLLAPYRTGAPWTGDTLANQAAAGGNVQTALLAAIRAIRAIHSKPIYDNGPTLGESLPWLIFIAVMVVASITAPFLWGPWLLRRVTGRGRR